ncbi:MAG TPA: TIGR04076 family protein [Candidatus Limiplasma sp.]|nr:TIGR04076 family protein [Candidatus Limiplasma sp.]
MGKVKLTITGGNCRCGYHRAGETFIVEDLCPPLCHELWNTVYPSVYVLLNGGALDYGEAKVTFFDAKCPDGGRVCIHGEVLSD